MSSDLRYLVSQLGLTPAESAVYGALIAKGTPMPIGLLIKDTGLHRGTVYNTLVRLIEKGCVHTAASGKDITYLANNGAILYRIEEDRKRLDAQTDIVKKLNDYISALRKVESGEKPHISIGHGQNAFKAFFMDLLAESKATGEQYRFYGNGGEMQDCLGKEYYAFTQRMKVGMGVRCNVILHEKKMDHSFSATVRGHIKWLAGDVDFGSVNTFISGKKVVLVDFGSRPMTTVFLEGKELVSHYQNLWKVLWKQQARKEEEAYEEV